MKGYVYSEALPRDVAPENRRYLPDVGSYAEAWEKAAAGAKLPDYRILRNGKLYSRSVTGGWSDPSHTAMGKAPDLVTESVPIIEEKLLPWIARNEAPEIDFSVDKIPTKKVFFKDDVNRLFDGIREDLFKIIDRLG